MLSAGDLDPSFGVGGKVLIDIGSGGDTAWDVAVQGDGPVYRRSVHA